MASFEGDPDHPILPDPWRWELCELTYRRNVAGIHEPYIDLVFGCNGTDRRLRFFSPQDLELSCGLPNTGGMCILDVSGRQLENIGVRVASFEQSYGTPTFWAARVVEVTQ